MPGADDHSARLMQQLLEQTPWERTPLGARATWSSCLTTILELTLDSSFPMFVIWGPERSCLYNGAFIAVLGEHHPAAWGRPLSEAWPEIWDLNRPWIERALKGEPCHYEDLPLHVERHGRRERAWFTIHYVPVREQGVVLGVHCICLETSDKIRAARRHAMQIKLFDQLHAQPSAEDVMLATSHHLGRYLRASRVLFGDLHRRRNTVSFHSNYTDGKSQPLVGDLPVAIFGQQNAASFDRGEVWVCADTSKDERTNAVEVFPAFQQAGIAAAMVVPILRRRKSKTLLFITYAHPVHWADDEIAFIEDIAERVGMAIEQARAHAALMRERNRSHRILNDMNEGFLLLDPYFHVLRLNQAGLRLHGLQSAPMPGALLWKAIPMLASSAAGEFIRHTMQHASPGEMRYRMPGGGDGERWLELRTMPDHEGMAIFFRDVTESVQREEHIAHAATHDHLTQLPNRALLNDRLQHALHKRAHKSVCLMVMDLDRFKHVNDSFGHAVGDNLLKVVASRLVHAVYEGDTVARVGGDEFTVLLEEVDGPEEVTAIAHKILAAVAEPIEIAGHQIRSAISIGASMYPQDGDDAATLLKHADVAMYHAKQARPGGFCFFDPVMNARALDRLLCESQLRAAVAANQFVVHYQPRFDARLQRVAGMEALVRWRHPEKGLIQPTEFIALAEEIGVVDKIDLWVLEEVCRQIQRWHSQAGLNVPISVNLSAYDMALGDLPQRVQQLLHATNTAPQALEFEITENGMMQDIDAAQRLLCEFQRMGISISVDDFGIGHSSLSYLKKLPIERLKIDKSFINGILVDADDRAIVTATIAMAANMGLEVVAEGVMQQEQIRLLSELGCALVQGFAVSEPLAPDAVPDFLQRLRPAA